MSIHGGHALRLAMVAAIAVLVVGLGATYSVLATGFQAAPRTAAHVSELSPAAPQADPEPARQQAAGPDSWDKRWWIEKAARLLRGGDGLGPRDDIDYLATLPKDEVARLFMQDERFSNMVLDFNMYFLGFKVDNLKVDGEFVHAAFDFSNAITSAKQLLAGGDYLTLFDLEGDYYMAPLSVSPTEEPLTPQDAKLTPQQLRQKSVDELIGEINKLRALRTAKPAVPLQEFCGKIEELTERRDELQSQLFRGFTDTEIFVFMRGGMPDFIFNLLERTVETECEKPADEASFKPLDDALIEATVIVERSFKEVQKFEPALYGPETVAEFKPVDHKAFPQPGKWVAFGFEQGTALANSSTNYNRKRAAYVLKRYFCDDLNPVGFDDPKEHVSGSHGTQTSCYACHYKLDPMAGFFRNYGALFADSSAAPDIVFDDLASMNLQKYLSTWQAPKETGRQWDVGYVRSPRWTEQNSYGETLGDLSGIIRKAPEAKRCLMKRLTQYALGDSQTVDGAYLDDLTAQFTRDAEQNSSAAFKNALVRVLESHAFEARDPDAKQCYDFAPNTNVENRPPCRVAYILEKNCVTCHDGNDVLNSLDLSKWKDAAGAKGKTFSHMTKAGEQMTASQSLQSIAARLASNDPRQRMPKNKPMSSQERQELYIWVQNELAKLERHTQ
jgi:hypothetical protein